MKFIIFILLTSNTLLAKEYIVMQAKKTFLKNLNQDELELVTNDKEKLKENMLLELNLKVGDEVKFLNRDRVSHNVRAINSDEDEFFDVRLQKPGEKHDKTIKVDRAGEYEIKCRIHPKMKMKLNVKEN